jgi:tRNA nucleotidyltransferase (CCA-adding enzyme)
MALPASTVTVILTHEHTDFDALASMLAAARLYPHATPVLPRLMNRNLEAFLAEYGDVLPFVRLEDLPKRRIDNVVLVDTQTVQPIRGMNPQTPVQIIDHHRLVREIPAGWSFAGEEVGATTTLLVERLAEQKVALTAVEATLLMLGIYEDTGALSYQTTHPRDLRAAAWLLERGANLLVVDKYLNHPLTDEQNALYQMLADNTQPYQFNGHSVIITSARVERPVSEISTLAHKLRDLYEPDALFMLVEMGDYIQMVARSSSEAVDVGKIAAAFGGGGHGRAAAALVRDASLASVYESLVYNLQSAIQPSVTVGQIMSYGAPQTLAPSDTIADAAERMRRYGFEGFPVLEEGRIVGMLTRREIDRAMHHGLEKHPVSRYMRAGEVFVTPEDSVASLRRVMTEHDWGQVPVIDDTTGALLGIVTRTDLIKQWAAPAQERTETLARQMSEALPAAQLRLLQQAGAVAHELGYPLYVVGGFARDLLLGLPNFDLDLVVEGDGIRLAAELVRRHGGRLRSHRRFGTAKWILPDEMRADGAGLPDSLDFVTARTEFYEHPTALPTVERSSIKQDLHRRDFTINTLAVRLTPDRWGELLDFYGGRDDLEAGVIRVLHSLSFVEDPTRILRAARFEQRFGFRIESRTEELIADALDLLDRVSPERVRHEVELILAEAEPERAICRLQEMGVLTKLHPALSCDAWFVGKAAELRSALRSVRDPASISPPPMDIAPDAGPRLHLALLLRSLSQQTTMEALDRLRARSTYRELALEVVRLIGSVAGLKDNAARPSDVVALLDGTSDEARLALRVACDDWLVRQRLDSYQRRWRHAQPLLNGNDLRKMGIPPGRVYRRILEALRAARLNGAAGSRADEEALARTIAASETHVD